MNLDIKHILLILLLFILSGFLLFSLNSCGPNYHLQKFYSKGGKISCDTIYVTKRDTLTIKGKDGKDSIIYITTTVPCNCPEATVETRWKTRFDNRRFRDSLKVISRMYKDSLKYFSKQNKVNKKYGSKDFKQSQKTQKTKIRKENKTFPWIWLFIAISLVFTFFIIKQFKQ